MPMMIAPTPAATAVLAPLAVRVTKFGARRGVARGSFASVGGLAAACTQSA